MPALGKGEGEGHLRVLCQQSQCGLSLSPEFILQGWGDQCLPASGKKKGFSCMQPALVLSALPRWPHQPFPEKDFPSAQVAHSSYLTAGNQPKEYRKAAFSASLYIPVPWIQSRKLGVTVLAPLLIHLGPWASATHPHADLRSSTYKMRLDQKRDSKLQCQAANKHRPVIRARALVRTLTKHHKAFIFPTPFC